MNTHRDVDSHLAEVQANREKTTARVREALSKIDAEALSRDLTAEGHRDIFVEAAVDLLTNQRVIDRLASNLDHQHFGWVVRNIVAEEMGNFTPRGWVEPLKVPGVRPSEVFCDEIRDRIVAAFGSH